MIFAILSLTGDEYAFTPLVATTLEDAFKEFKKDKGSSDNKALVSGQSVEIISAAFEEKNRSWVRRRTLKGY